MFTNDEVKHIETIKQKTEAYTSVNSFGVRLEDNHYHNLVWAGGMFASLIQGNLPKDHDLFILNDDRDLYSRIINSFFYKPIIKTQETHSHYFAVAPHIVSVTNGKGSKYQVILTTCKTKEELLSTFDFVHCRTNICYERSALTGVPMRMLYTSPEAYRAAKEKVLIENNPMKRPAQWRYDKFTKRGYKIEFITDTINSAIKNNLAYTPPKPHGGYQNTYINTTGASWITA